MQPNSDNSTAFQPLTYSIATACQMLGIGRTRVYELINEGHVETVRIGRRRLVKAASLRKLIEQGC